LVRIGGTPETSGGEFSRMKKSPDGKENQNRRENVLVIWTFICKD
jgi:hypothetical protein